MLKSWRLSPVTERTESEQYSWSSHDQPMGADSQGRKGGATGQLETINPGLAAGVDDVHESPPVSRVLSWTTISLRRDVAIAPQAPTCDSNGAGSTSSRSGLAPGGVCNASSLAVGAVGSYPAFSPLPTPVARRRRFAFCCTVPIPPRLETAGFTSHPALWSPDFPRPSCDGRGRLAARGHSRLLRRACHGWLTDPGTRPLGVPTPACRCDRDG